MRMMYGLGSMGFASLFVFLFWILLLVNMLLLAIWLFKQITKDKGQ